MVKSNRSVTPKALNSVFNNVGIICGGYCGGCVFLFLFFTGGCYISLS